MPSEGFHLHSSGSSWLPVLHNVSSNQVHTKATFEQRLWSNGKGIHPLQGCGKFEECGVQGGLSTDLGLSSKSVLHKIHKVGQASSRTPPFLPSDVRPGKGLLNHIQHKRNNNAHCSSRSQHEP